MTRVRTSRIIRQYGSWAITVFGLECTERSYPIAKDCVHETDWLDHMASKRWVNATDFEAALTFARQYFRNVSKTSNGREIAR